jgi:hypothetical protein
LEVGPFRKFRAQYKGQITAQMKGLFKSGTKTVAVLVTAPYGLQPTRSADLVPEKVHRDSIQHRKNRGYA